MPTGTRRQKEVGPARGRLLLEEQEQKRRPQAPAQRHGGQARPLHVRRLEHRTFDLFVNLFVLQCYN